MKIKYLILFLVIAVLLMLNTMSAFAVPSQAGPGIGRATAEPALSLTGVSLPGDASVGTDIANTVPSL